MVVVLAMSCGLAAGQDVDRITINAKSLYPEGPLVDGKLLYYAEMGSNRVMRWDGTGNTVLWSRRGCGPTSVARHPAGGLNVLCHIEGALIHITEDGTTLGVIDHEESGGLFSDPNASTNNANNGIYFSSSGSFAPGAKAEGAILYLDPRSSLRRVAEGIHYANGVALSPDGSRLYVSEHLSRRVLIYEVAEDGSLSNGEVFVSLDDLLGEDPRRGWEVGPDGLATDASGDLFIAEYGAGHVLVVDPSGALSTIIPVPQAYVTGVALSPDEERLFITAPASLTSSVAGAVYSIANPLAED